MTDRLLALYGTDEPLLEERRLSAGALEAIFSGGAVRNISLQGVEVIRGIYFLIRDRNWATVVPDIRDLHFEESKARFAVTFSAHGTTPSDGQRLVWRGRIEGSAKDGLMFSARATADDDFQTCRTGFVVLHPLQKVSGCPVTIEHTDGRIEQSAFPDLIDPLQSFFDIRAMTHEPIPGTRATCRMEGGAWECEDHRNWLDASFKTYFRPLSLPWPYVVTKGEQIEQTVSLSFSPSVTQMSPAEEPAETTVTVGDRTGGTWPSVGLSITTEDLDSALVAAESVSAVGAQVLALRIASSDPDLPGVLRKCRQLAGSLAAKIVLEIVVAERKEPAAELDLVAVAGAGAGLRPSAVVVSPEIDLHSFPPSVDRPSSIPLQSLYVAARRAFPNVALGGGMYSFFTELNRRRPPIDDLDFVQHATASIVHAADDRSVMETLESLPHVFRSARSFVGTTPYRIGPANIAMGFNPYGDSTTPNPDNLKRTMVTKDPRHQAIFGAAWATGYFARATAANIEAVTMGSPAGPFGIAADGKLYPIFHVLRDFAAAAGAVVLQTASSAPLTVLAAAVEQSTRRTLWVANLTPREQSVRVKGLKPASVQVIDVASKGTLADRSVPSEGALRLDAFGVAKVIW